jgi:hypothetical protein
MPLFVNDEDSITITVYYTSQKNSSGVRITKMIDKKKAEEMLKIPEKAAIVEQLNCKFRLPTWAAQQKLFSESNVYDPALGAKDTDLALFSDLQLKKNLIGWDATDENGRELPVTSELIDMLPPSIANDILGQYRRSLTSGDDSGN